MLEDKMKKYAITLKSKDGDIFEYVCRATSDGKATTLALKKVEDNAWTHHKYEIVQLQRLK